MREELSRLVRAAVEHARALQEEEALSEGELRELLSNELDEALEDGEPAPDADETGGEA